MTPRQYQIAAAQFDMPEHLYQAAAERLGCDSNAARSLHYIAGFEGEKGELIDCLKKRDIYGRELDKLNLVEEIGGCLWFHAMVYAFHESTLGDEWHTPMALGKPYNDLHWALEIHRFKIYPLAIIAARHGFTLKQCARANIAQLTVRNGGTSFRDNPNRDKAAERAAIAKEVGL